MTFGSELLERIEIKRGLDLEVLVVAEAEALKGSEEHLLGPVDLLEV